MNARAAKATAPLRSPCAIHAHDVSRLVADIMQCEFGNFADGMLMWFRGTRRRICGGLRCADLPHATTLPLFLSKIGGLVPAHSGRTVNTAGSRIFAADPATGRRDPAASERRFASISLGRVDVAKAEERDLGTAERFCLKINQTERLFPRHGYGCAIFRPPHHLSPSAIAG